MKFDSTLMKCIRKDLEKNLIPMLLGEPGIGKSSWLQALADTMHTKCFVLACNQLADKADLTGARLVPVLNDKGDITTYKQTFYPHAIIHDAIAYAEENPRETPILFMDELNRTTPDVTSEALSIPTLRSIGSKKLPDNLRVVIAGNDKGNITALDEASISRFVLYHVIPDTQTFLNLDPQLNIFVRNVLTAHPECIFGKQLNTMMDGDDDTDDNDYTIDEILDGDENMSQITTPRTISGISTWLNSFTNQELMELLANTYFENGREISALQEAIEGHVGATKFATLLLADIASNIMNTNSQTTAFNVGKPTCYDDMKNCKTIDELKDLINNLSEREKSGCLVYTMFEQCDNEKFIRILSENIQSLNGNDMKTLMTLAATDKLDKDNVNVLLQTKTNLSNKLAVILEN